MKIIVDVLNNLDHLRVEGEEAGITRITRRTNITYSRLRKILERLAIQGLVEKSGQDGKPQTFRTSEKGSRFLAAYGEFNSFAESFGFTI